MSPPDSPEPRRLTPYLYLFAALLAFASTALSWHWPIFCAGLFCLTMAAVTLFTPPKPRP